MKNILIVVDMQKDFVIGSLGSDDANNIIDNVVNKIRNHNGVIIATYDTHFENYLDTAEGKKLPVQHCIKGTEGWNIDERVFAALSEKGFISLEKSAFGSVDLPAVIIDLCGKEEFQAELIGLCTDICVISNAIILKANFPETEIKVDASCCAGITQKSHLEALNVMKACQIEVVG